MVCCQIQIYTLLQSLAVLMCTVFETAPSLNLNLTTDTK